MRFELTEDQRALRDEVREFAKTEIEPKARSLDQDEEYPSTILDDSANAVLTSVTLPEEYGGRGEGLVELTLMIEELSARLVGVHDCRTLQTLQGVEGGPDRDVTVDETPRSLKGQRRLSVAALTALAGALSDVASIPTHRISCVISRAIRRGNPCSRERNGGHGGVDRRPDSADSPRRRDRHEHSRGRPE